MNRPEVTKIKHGPIRTHQEPKRNQPGIGQNLEGKNHNQSVSVCKEPYLASMTQFEIRHIYEKFVIAAQLERLMRVLTYYSSVLLIYTPWKHQKI